MYKPMSKPTVFISYSHKDEEWKDRLVTQLKVLELEGSFQVWDDRQIAAGSDWLPGIEEALNAAAAAILLVSADFLISNFISSREVPRLLQRRQTDGVLVAPLIIRPCAWRKVQWLSKIQARPAEGKALSTMEEHQAETALATLAEEVAELLDKPRARLVLKPGSQVAPSRLPITGSFDELCKNLAEFWRPYLQEAISTLDYKLKTYHCDEPVQISKTNWTDLIVNCLPFLVAKDKLQDLLPKKDFSLPEVGEVLPLLPLAELYERLNHSALPPGGPPHLFPDWAKASQVEGLIDIYHYSTAVKHYDELRRHYSNRILGSFANALMDR